MVAWMPRVKGNLPGCSRGSVMRFTKFHEHAVGGLRVEEGDPGAASTRAGLLVDEIDVGGFQVSQLLADIVGSEGQVVQTFAAFFDELMDWTVRRGGFEQFDGHVAGFEHGDADFLLGYFLDMREFQAERIDPELLCLVDTLHGDAD